MIAAGTYAGLMAVDEEAAWAKMTGAELAHILAMREHAVALQAALDAAPAHGANADWAAIAAGVLRQANVDPGAPIDDATTDKCARASRVEVMADELRRAALEEG